MNAIIIASVKAEIDVLKTYLTKVSLINLVAVIENPEGEVPALNQDEVSVLFLGGELVGEKGFEVFDFFDHSIPVVAFSKD